jgi:hypothetical protein
MSPRECYLYHDLPISDFDTGKTHLSSMAVSAGASDVFVADTSMPPNDCPAKVSPGHTGFISHCLVSQGKIITGAKDGGVVVSNFGFYDREKKYMSQTMNVP